MCKIRPLNLNGLEFIQLSRLPLFQSQRLREWLPSSSLMKLKIAGKTIEDCIPYIEYENWYNFQFRNSNKTNFDLYL